MTFFVFSKSSKSLASNLCDHSMSAHKLGVEVGSHNLYEDDPDQVRGNPPDKQTYFVHLSAVVFDF